MPKEESCRLHYALCERREPAYTDDNPVAVGIAGARRETAGVEETRLVMVLVILMPIADLNWPFCLHLLHDVGGAVEGQRLGRRVRNREKVDQGQHLLKHKDYF